MNNDQKNKISNVVGLPFGKLNYLVHVDDKRQIAYFETPKVCCTSIKKYMQDKYICKVQHYPNASTVHDRQVSPLILLETLNLAEVEEVLFGGFRRFTFVRNPLSRSLSAYLDKLVNNAHERERHRPMLGFDATYEPSFTEYLEALKGTADTARAIHHQSQDSLTCVGRISFDFVGRFETFDRDFKQLQAELYGETELTNYTKFGMHHSVNTARNLANYHTEETVALTNDLYAVDFARWGYSKDLQFAQLQGRRKHKPVAKNKVYEFQTSAKPSPADRPLPEFEVAWNLLLKMNYDEARDRFLTISQEKPPSALAHRAFDCANFCHMKGDIGSKKSLQLFSEPCADQFAETIKPIYLASDAIHREDWNDYWRLAPTLSAFDARWFGPWNRGLSSRPEYASTHALHNLAQDDVRKISFKDKGSSPILLMAADSNYFVRHARLAIQSYRHAGGVEEIVLVILNPTAEATILANELMRVFKRVQVIFERNVPTQKAYFASARYLMAAQLMIDKKRPVFVFDIDVGFAESVSDFFARTRLEPEKIGLRISPLYCYPWEKITVNCVYLPFNSAGLTFARHMQLFLEAQFSIPDHQDIWWIDQNAALSAFSLMDKEHVQSLHVKGFIGLPKQGEDRESSIRAALSKR